ncbi:MAG: hypothetical protein ACP5N0_11410 [Methanosarcina sp.]
MTELARVSNYGNPEFTLGAGEGFRAQFKALIQLKSRFNFSKLQVKLRIR